MCEVMYHIQNIVFLSSSGWIVYKSLIGFLSSMQGWFLEYALLTLVNTLMNYHGQNCGGSYILAMVCDDDVSFSWLCLLYLLSGKMLAGACILWSVLSMPPTDQRIHRNPIHVYIVFGHRFCCGVTNAIPTTRANFYW